MYEFWLRLTTKEYWVVSKNYWTKSRQAFKDQLSAKGKGGLYRMRYTRKHGWQPEFLREMAE